MFILTERQLINVFLIHNNLFFTKIFISPYSVLCSTKDNSKQIQANLIANIVLLQLNEIEGIISHLSAIHSGGVFHFNMRP